MVSKQPIRLSDDRNPWDRQPGESERQYSRFVSYLELNRGRTLKQTAEMLHAMGDTRVSYRTLQQYAYEYRWPDRAEAFDRHQDKLDRERLLAKRREMTERHQRVATGLLAKAVAALQQFKPEDFRPADVARFVQLATELERTALGEPQHTIGVSGPGGGPLVTQDLSGLTPYERQQRLETIVTELSRRAAYTRDDEDE